MSQSLKDKTVKGVVWSAVERFSVAGVGFAFGLMLARLLSPSDYGVIAMLNIFMAVSQTFIDSGFSTALIRKPDRTDVDNCTVFYFNIVVSVFFYFVLFFCAPLIASFYNEPVLTGLTRFMALGLVIGSISGVQGALLTIKIDFKTQAKITLTGQILSGIVGVFLAYKGFGVWSLAIQGILGGVIRTILMWVLSDWRPRWIFSVRSFKEMFSFGSKMLASALLDTIWNNLYDLVIGKKFSAASLGVYARANHFAQFPSSNITGILSRVTFPVLASIQNEDKRLEINYRKFLRLSAFVVFPLMMILAGVAEPLIRWLLTDKWAEAFPLLQILCFSLMWYPIHAINLNLQMVKGRSDLFLKLEVYKKILGVIVLCITLPMGLTAMCYGKIFTCFVCLFLNTRYTGRLIHVGFGRQMMDLAPNFANSLILFCLCWLVQHYLPAPNAIRLFAAAIAGLTYYAAINYLAKSQDLKELVLLFHRS